MHIPDGFLSIPVTGSAIAATVVGVGGAIRSLRKRLADRLIPLMGVLAAFIFAAQMFNFPVASGTSGHLLGGVLAAVVVGPAAATVILTVVLIVQCLFFADGGLLALGANILNMALVGTWAGWGIYWVVRKVRGTPSSDRIAIFLGAWSSVVIASGACALELALSGTAPATIVIPAMLGIHAIIGIGEGIITALVVSFLAQVQPQLLAKEVA